MFRSHEEYADSLIDEASEIVHRLHSTNREVFGHVDEQHAYDFLRLFIYNKPKYNHLATDDEKLAAYAADCNAADKDSYHNARYAR